MGKGTRTQQWLSGGFYCNYVVVQRETEGKTETERQTTNRQNITIKFTFWHMVFVI